MRDVLIVSVVLLAASLAGGVGSDGGGSSAAPAEAGDGGDPEDADAGDGEGTGARPLAYDAPNATQRLQRNGSYAPQEACATGGCPTGDAWQETDITGIVPAGVPARVYVNITHDGLPVYQPFSAWLQPEDTTFYGYSSSFQQSSIEIQALMVRAETGSVQAVVQLFAPDPTTGSGPNTDYTLEATAVPVTSRVDRGVPVEVDLEPGQTIEATTAGEDADETDVAFRVYGPDDAAAAYVTSDNGSATWTVPENRSAGAYVLANTWASDLELSTTGEGPMRALTTDWIFSDPSPFDGSGTVEWDFDLSRDPVWTGIYVQDRDVEGPLEFRMDGPTVTVSGFNATLTMPDGGTAGGAWECGICISGGVYAAFGPARGDPGLVAGTYDAELSSDASVNFEYGHLVAHYVR